MIKVKWKETKTVNQPRITGKNDRKNENIKLIKTINK